MVGSSSASKEIFGKRERARSTDSSTSSSSWTVAREARVVAARELEQAADQVAHLVRLALQVLEQPLARFRIELDGADRTTEHVEVRLHARQRRAQLVRRVGDEAPLRLDRVLQRRQHRVERRAEPRDLVVAALGHALARVARARDPLGRVGQAAHRRERRARDERAAGGGRDDAAERDEDQDQAQAVQVVVQVVHLRRDDDRAGERRQQRRDDLAPVVALDHRRADVHARLLAGRRRLDRGVDRDRRAGCDLPGGADDLDVVGGLRVEAAEAEVGAVLHLRRLMADLRVDLAEEVVPHQVVDGHRRAAEHDRHDRGRDERQPEAKRHGSRRT